VHRCIKHQYISAGSDVPSLVMTLLQKKETLQVIRRVLPICQDIAYSFCFTVAETEIHKIKDDSKIMRQTNLDRRGLRPTLSFATFLTLPLSRYRLPLRLILFLRSDVSA
jgi:hypothetical protein